MLQLTHSVRYRCAKCKHRLSDAEPRCSHCGWEVDLALAAERAAVFSRKKRHRRHDTRRKKIALILVSVFAVTAVLLLVLHLMNSA